MLRFLAALFALFTLIAFAADVSRPPVDGQSWAAISLLQHLQTLAPVVRYGAPAVSHTLDRPLLLWNPILTSVLSLPASRDLSPCWPLACRLPRTAATPRAHFRQRLLRLSRNGGLASGHQRRNVWLSRRILGIIQ